MSTFIEGANVHLDDINGHPATIPTRALHVVTRYAEHNDDAVAPFGLHVFGRDALIGARGLLDDTTRCHFADQYVTCDERAGTDADGHTLTNLSGSPVCDGHAPDDDSGA